MLALILVTVISTIAIILLLVFLLLELLSNRPFDESAEEMEMPIVLGRQEKNKLSYKREKTRVVTGDDDDDDDASDKKKINVTKSATIETAEIKEREIEYSSPSHQSGEDFGHATLMNAKYMIVSAPGHGTSSATNASGVVYVFNRTTRKLKKTIYPPRTSPDLRFGTSLSFEDDDKTLIVADGLGKQYKISL